MLETTDTSRKTPPLSALVHTGDVHRFGPDGVLYEILKVLDGDKALIRVLDTGEELPYAITKIVADPTD